MLLEEDAEEERTELGREYEGELVREEDDRDVEYDGVLCRGAWVSLETDDLDE